MTRNAELDIKWSGGLGTTAVVAPAVQRPPLQLIYIKLCLARQASEFSVVEDISNNISMNLSISLSIFLLEILKDVLGHIPKIC